jgi:hypothetical protein
MPGEAEADIAPRAAYNASADFSGLGDLHVSRILVEAETLRGEAEKLLKEFSRQQSETVLRHMNVEVSPFYRKLETILSTPMRGPPDIDAVINTLKRHGEHTAANILERRTEHAVRDDVKNALSVDVPSVTKTASLTVLITSIYSLITYGLTGFMIIHPFVSVILIAASIMFYLMGEMVYRSAVRR